MKSFQKKILLYNLFHNRRVITIDTIKNVCNVSERTAYRYINQLSEINVPIYYDKELGGYCLNRDTEINDINDLDDIILIIVSLKSLFKLVNNSYKVKIDKLITTLLVKQKYSLEEIFQSFNVYFDNNHQTEDYSKLLTSLLLYSAMKFKKKINVTLNDENISDNIKFIENPDIIFENRWKISDHAKNLEDYNIDDILMVTFEKN